ncbi:MAG TPA: ABC transporter permease [Jiangellaceae bacterium]
MTGLVSALVEAWSEVRVHKVRVILSLIGVMIAVVAMTVITAVGDMARQANAEYSERMSGRPATLGVSVYGEQTQPDEAAVRAAFAEVVERYQIAYSSTNSYTDQVFRFPDGNANVQTQLVDRLYGELHRVETVHGSWFTESDETRFAPPLVVNEAFLARLGVPDLSGHPSITLGGPRPVTAVVVGVMADDYEGAEPMAYLLSSAYQQWSGTAAGMYGPPTLELWVPPDQAEELTDLITRDLTASMGEGTQVDIYRQDSASFDSIDDQLNWVIRGVSAFALALGALGLVNIALVTVKYRIREIGIRRSFGATSGRVFFSVLMESVCATVVAGLVGVAIAVAIVENLPPDVLTGGAVADVPPFPIRAAVEGMVAATVVGGLAGLLPAIVAVRVKVIDAIRY